MRTIIAQITMLAIALALIAWSINQIGLDEFLRILPYILGIILLFIIGIITSANRPRLGK